MRFLTVFALALSLSSMTLAVSQAQQAGPVGITVTKHGDGWHFADAKGLALYTYDKDETPGKSACNGECAKTWPPYVAADDAKPLGGFDIIVREDGVHQWTYRGKPLYGYAKEQNAETTFGDGFGAAWHVAFQPIAVPPEVTFGKALIGSVLADVKGLTLYTLDDGKTCTGACLVKWTPVAAPWAAVNVGDWTPVARDDGTVQWAYKGKPLYSYSGDVLPGETLGDGVDKIWHAAILEPAPPVPSWVTYQGSDAGEIVANADGHTLYTYNPRFNARGPVISADRVKLASEGVCDAECRTTDEWIPVLADANAQSMGNWTVINNDEGARQWAFKGKALYTNNRDKAPGEFKGVNFGDIAWKGIMRSGISMQGTSPGG
jgi:predicted lipoprotein with Yx(FWY)xxD motif